MWEYDARMAVINDCSHLYVTALHTHHSSSGFPAETWQYGFRLAVSGSQLSLDSGVVNLERFTVQDAAVTRDNTDYDIEQSWSGVTVGGRTITDADKDAIAQAVRTAFTSMAPSLNNQIRYAGCKIYAVRLDASGKFLSGAPDAYWSKVPPGGALTTAMPPDSAVAVSLYTATRGVKGRGRVYIGGQGTSNVTQTGRVSTTAVDRFGNTIADLLDACRSIGTPTSNYYVPIVWHRVGDKYGVEDGFRGSVISRVEVNDIWDTQRRRDFQGIPDWSQYPLA